MYTDLLRHYPRCQYLRVGKQGVGRSPTCLTEFRKSRYFKEKTQYLMNTLYLLDRTIDCKNCRLLFKNRMQCKKHSATKKIFCKTFPCKIFSPLETHIDYNNRQNAKSHKSLMIQNIVTNFLSIRF